jgi:hypothetical protein
MSARTRSTEPSAAGPDRDRPETGTLTDSETHGIFRDIGQIQRHIQIQSLLILSPPPQVLTEIGAAATGRALPGPKAHSSSAAAMAAAAAAAAAARGGAVAPLLHGLGPDPCVGALAARLRRAAFSAGARLQAIIELDIICVIQWAFSAGPAAAAFADDGHIHELYI